MTNVSQYSQQTKSTTHRTCSLLVAVTLLLGSFLPRVSYAETTSQSSCTPAIEASVNGLVCDFCARALEKVFGNKEEVASIKVDLDKSIVTISLNPGKTLDDSVIESLITDAGYSISQINRSDCHE